jgi:hypothetical protein
VVKILAAGVRRAFGSDVLSIYASNAIWEILANFLKYSCVGDGICCACRAVHMAQVVSLIIDAMTDLLIRIENESCLKEIPVERYMQ